MRPARVQRGCNSGIRRRTARLRGEESEREDHVGDDAGGCDNEALGDRAVVEKVPVVLRIRAGPADGRCDARKVSSDAIGGGWAERENGWRTHTSSVLPFGNSTKPPSGINPSEYSTSGPCGMQSELRRCLSGGWMRRG